MAATIGIYEWNGAGPTGTSSAGGVRFRSADTATVDTSNPLVKAAANGTVRSYKKSLRLYCTAKNTSTSISSVTAYVSGSSWGTGLTLMSETSPSLSYSQASGAVANDTGATDASGYTSGSPLTLGAGPYTLTDSTAVAHPYWCLYMKAVTSADGTTPAVGTVAAGATLTIAWNEV